MLRAWELSEMELLCVPFRYSTGRFVVEVIFVYIVGLYQAVHL